MSGLEVIREMRKVDCHFRRFGRISKQIFYGGRNIGFQPVRPRRLRLRGLELLSADRMSAGRTD
jgi:hypothetical protein